MCLCVLVLLAPMFRLHHQASADDTALTPPSWGLNNSGGTGVNQGASTSDRAGPLTSSSPISATAQDRANIRGVEQLVAHLAHNQEIAGSNPAPATTTQPDEGSADCLPAICSGGNGGATGAPVEPVSSRDPLADPRAGDRVRVRSGMVATVRKVKLGRPDSVEYVYADRDGTHFAAAALSAWRSLCRGGKVVPHPTETAAYWRGLARDEMAAARDDRARRGASAESILLHERNARDYVAKAEAIEARVQIGEGFDAVEVVR